MRSPQSFLFPRLNNPSALGLSLQDTSSSSSIILVDLHSMHSCMSMSHVGQLSPACTHLQVWQILTQHSVCVWQGLSRGAASFQPTCWQCSAWCSPEGCWLISGELLVPPYPNSKLLFRWLHTMCMTAQGYSSQFHEVLDGSLCQPF